MLRKSAKYGAEPCFQTSTHTTYIQHVSLSAASADSEGAVWLMRALVVNEWNELHCSGWVAVAGRQRHCNQETASCNSPGAVSRMPGLVVSVPAGRQTVGLVECGEVDKSMLENKIVHAHRTSAGRQCGCRGSARWRMLIVHHCEVSAPYLLDWAWRSVV